MESATPHFIDGQWVAGTGETIVSTDPSTGEVVWAGRAAGEAEIDAAVAAARRAAGDWAAASLDQRFAVLERFAGQLKANRQALAELISREIGKPLWESLTEVDAMIAKEAISRDALLKRRHDEVIQTAAGTGATRFKPHGIVAVFGPFNFPGHLPNGHIVPALLAGNTVVFKPSEFAPAVGQKVIELWQAAGVPAGVINLAQGARDTGVKLSRHPGIDGLLFTGSVAAGKALSAAFADRPEKILALELGGNAPLVVHESADVEAAVYHTIQSAFITSGQRCSCARRLILPQGKAGDAFLDRLVEVTRRVRVGGFRNSPEPFMGPVVSDRAAEHVSKMQEELVRLGGCSLVPVAPGQRSAMLSPGIIDVTGVSGVSDEEIFGPLLKVIRVADFHAAIAEANRTAFGLAAALLGGDESHWQRFWRNIRAGVMNWNRPTTAAASTLPFGGVGLSGNHRPSAYFAADYCSYPVASLEDAKLELPAQRSPGIGM